MGLIKAALGAAGGVMADQWKEYFYCEAIPENVMAVKGLHRVSGRSTNYKGSENISAIAWQKFPTPPTMFPRSAERATPLRSRSKPSAGPPKFFPGCASLTQATGPIL